VNWQPQDLLPNPESPDFLDEIAELQKRTANIPDEHLVVLVGDMITEVREGRGVRGLGCGLRSV
jgi:acyl-[acyl-carrier-protein] desaturase